MKTSKRKKNMRKHFLTAPTPLIKGLYCCLCFCKLTPAKCNVTTDGQKDDVCVPCAAMEAVSIELIARREMFKLAMAIS